MSFRFNGWQRIGIVASVLWVLGAGLMARLNDAREAQEMYQVTYDNCIRAEELTTGRGKALAPEIVSGCHKEGLKAYQVSMHGQWAWEVLMVSIVPILLGWLLAYMVIGVWRWVRRGFNIPPSPQ